MFPHEVRKLPAPSAKPADTNKSKWGCGPSYNSPWGDFSTVYSRLKFNRLFFIAFG